MVVAVVAQLGDSVLASAVVVVLKEFGIPGSRLVGFDTDFELGVELGCGAKNWPESWKC